ncbi:hypothetical protein [Humibacter ginsenosidimutans]|uniref:Uncharacterized protein n=1 Tax=Humibacter ginsenosidimutans TaxID=2599293 RepID=A0A5B8M840_9MICO|nr:hypothetical protein [Humibacter ginsenosidimutans]QDZ15762.1 hypothetical protein FPZ11_14230 [Humibacter ginsenosidimutans]
MAEIEPLLRVGTTRAERTAAREDAHQAQVRESFASITQNSPWRAEELEQQLVRGEWIFYWSPVIDQMKREGRLVEALELALECVDCAERSLRIGPNGDPPRGWTEKAAVIARKLKRYDFEVEIIERYFAIVADPSAYEGLTHRLGVARRLAASAVGDTIRP